MDNFNTDFLKRFTDDAEYLMHRFRVSVIDSIRDEVLKLDSRQLIDLLYQLKKESK